MRSERLYGLNSRLAAERGRFAQCDASADRRTPLGARGAGGNNRRIHRVSVTPCGVARANRVASAGAMGVRVGGSRAGLAAAIASNASSVERALWHASEALRPELPRPPQRRSV